MTHQAQAQTRRRLAQPWRKAASQHPQTPPAASRARPDPRAGASVARPARPVSPCSGGTPSQVWDCDHEPDLNSVLTDPIVGLVMSRDGLSIEEVAGIARRTRQRLLEARAG
ncbi:hypothetical protein [Roseospira goensis]|uniref:Uncharacterized protein n=1 Tax=Roseospira goensis TaxID=391922 RepID=A0A7W6RZL0_9PROT|nr:hypothetical protein [Roseospira goensis]MBB4285462.1 hypothetical protein [Roseospira goensis]